MNRSLELTALEQVPVFQGSRPEDAIHETVRLAVAVEELGYRRFWVAEHHGDASRGCASPSVLAAAIAVQTRSIRVGSGCVILPYTHPLRTAEEHLLLAALAPGRIDLGIGRGSSGVHVEEALGVAEDVGFPGSHARRVAELMRYLAAEYAPNPSTVLAIPAITQPPEVWIMAAGRGGALLAAALGLSLSLAYFLSGDAAEDAAKIYREAFIPSDTLTSPRLNVAARVACAATREEAETAAACIWIPSAIAAGLGDCGESGPYHPSLDIASRHRPTDAELAFRTANPHLVIYGTPDEVAEQLQDLGQRFGTDDVTITTSTPHLGDRIHMHSLIIDAL